MSFLNHALRDCNLSYKAKGIFTSILLSGDREVTLKYLLTKGFDGESGLRSGLRELVNYHYIYEIEGKQGECFRIDVKALEKALGEADIHPKILENESSESKQLISYKDNDDDLYHKAVLLSLELGKISVYSLQHNFHIGYDRASRLIKRMEDQGIVSKPDGSRPRKVLISLDEYHNLSKDIVRE
jgi:DNA segregation ATPase FtsK/SpoIIIE-like protein